MIVVKAGGNVGLDMDAVCTDVAALVQTSENVVLVHGGSNETNVISEKLGHPPRFVTSVSGHVSRYTDRETLEIFAMVAAGRINKLWVERLQQLGANAVGLSGLDGRLVECKRKPALRVVENGRVCTLAGWHREKGQSVFIVIESVDCDTEHIAGAIEIIPFLGAGLDFGGLTIIEPSGDKEVIIIKSHKYLGSLRRLAPEARTHHHHRERLDTFPS